MVQLSLVRPFKGESDRQLTVPARLHEALLEGRPLTEVQDQVLRSDSKDLVAYFQPRNVEAGAAARAQGVKKRWQELAQLGAIVGGVTGGLVAATLGLAVVPGALAGAAVLALASYASVQWQTRKSTHGDTVVEHNGKVQHRQWTVDPKNVDMTPAGVLSDLEARGLLGDDIAAAHIDTPAATPQQLETLNPWLGTLQDLDGDRRLVADLGNHSRYGHDVLDAVDADTARRLLAAGGKIFVVDSDKVRDSRDTTKMHSRSSDGLKDIEETAGSVRRTMDYRLTEISSPDQLAQINPANGLPENMAGVYRNATQITLPVYTGSREFARNIDWDRRSTSRHESDSLRPGADPSLAMRPAEAMPEAWSQFHWSQAPTEPKARKYGYAGAAIAGLAAVSVGIAATLTGLAIGPIAGCMVIASVFAGTFLGACVGNAVEGER